MTLHAKNRRHSSAASVVDLVMHDSGETLAIRPRSVSFGEKLDFEYIESDSEPESMVSYV